MTGSKNATAPGKPGFRGSSAANNVTLAKPAMAANNNSHMPMPPD
jgi:hypothetical protein